MTKKRTISDIMSVSGSRLNVSYVKSEMKFYCVSPIADKLLAIISGLRVFLICIIGQE
jgi:hypothetical protein